MQRNKHKVTPELIEQSALQLRRTRLSKSRAQALAPEIARLNEAALETGADNDFNEEPSNFPIMLARLKTPDSRA